MMVYGILAAICAIFAFSNAILSVRKFSTIFNPWFFFFAVELFFLHFISFLGLLSIGESVTKNEFNAFLLCSSVYAFGFSLSYFLRFSPIEKIIELSIIYIPQFEVNKKIIFYSFVFYFSSMCILIFSGSAGIIWLTDPRQAYISYRGATGDGAAYVLVQWSLMVTSAIWLFWAKGNWRRISFAVIGLIIASYFTGSKQILLGVLIFTIFTIDRFRSNISLAKFSFFSFLLGIIFIFLLSFGQEQNRSIFIASYFSEYSANTMKIFSKSFENMFSPGEFFSSKIWEYLPRFLFPEKPYEYGQVLINSVLFPGAAENGATPGLLYWSPYYLESGIFGVFIFSLLNGFIASGFFRVLQKTENRPLHAIFSFSNSVTPMMLYAPILYQYVFILVLSIVFRFLGSKPKNSSALKAIS